MDMVTEKNIFTLKSVWESKKFCLQKIYFKNIILHGIKIKYYHTDNRVFILQDFIIKIYKSEQKIVFWNKCL